MKMLQIITTFIGIILSAYFIATFILESPEVRTVDYIVGTAVSLILIWVSVCFVLVLISRGSRDYLRKLFVVFGLLLSIIYSFVLVKMPISLGNLYGFGLLQLSIWLLMYFLLWVTDRKNKRLVWLRVLLALIDTAVFYALVSLFYKIFPNVGYIEFFLIASVTLGFLENRGIIKTTLGEKILRLKREDLGYDVSTNIRFREAPLRFLSFFLPVQYWVRIFWVKELEGVVGWEDKAVESIVSKVSTQKVKEEARNTDRI